MKSLIITVAGTATRFNKDTEEDTLKCLYHAGSADNSLLSQIIFKATDVDEIIIVGGYLFEKLTLFVECNLSEFSSKIKLVYNPEFKTFGSGFSLIKGIEALNPRTDEIVFVEGDLFFNGGDFEKVLKSGKSVFAVNRDLITSNKAVAVYEDVNGHIHYLYDTSHKYLEISEPFIAVYNSGQIWKFTDPERLREVVATLSDKQIRGTNLEIVQGYFGLIAADRREMVVFETWFNCNTVSDYNKVYSILQDENN